MKKLFLGILATFISFLVFLYIVFSVITTTMVFRNYEKKLAIANPDYRVESYQGKTIKNVSYDNDLTLYFTDSSKITIYAYRYTSKFRVKSKK